MDASRSEVTAFGDIERLTPDAFNVALIAALTAAGCVEEDLGAAAYNHGVLSEQYHELVLQLPRESRVPFVAGYCSAKGDKALSTLSVRAGHPALSVESLGSSAPESRLKRLLERTEVAGGVIDDDDEETRCVANALEDLSIPLEWLHDALVSNGMEQTRALHYIHRLLPYWNEDQHLTDRGNARRCIALYGTDIRFCPGRGWLVWDGKRWRMDTVGEIEYRAKQIAATWKRDADLIFATAMFSGPLSLDIIMDRAEAMWEWAKASESSAKISAIVRVAQTEPGIPVLNSALDADPWVLNVKNGTIDLRTLNLRPHCREDLITKLAPVNYRPGARLDLWERFLDQITGGDGDFQEYLQRLSGYQATGDTSEEVFFFFYGPGGSGKSTLVRGWTMVLGDYAATADFETFVKRAGGGSPRNDIARLDGRRMVVSIEVDEGRELAQGIVKTITGGDTVSARYLYKEFFEFVPTFKLDLVANDPPGVDPDDSAMWRRLRVVPLDNVVPEEDRKPWVKLVLTDPDIAGSAILNWMLEGCRKWQAGGLGEAIAVQEATKDYRESQDILGEFFDEYCTMGPGLQVRSADLYSTYTKWAQLSGMFPLSPNAFGRKLRKKGFTPGKMDGDRCWEGLIINGTTENALAWGLQGMPSQSALPRGS